MHSLVLTIIGVDRPGLVESLAKVVAEHGGNWLESRMAHLAGQFAGILHLDIAQAQEESLIAALRNLDEQGMHVTVQTSIDEPVARTVEPVLLELIGNDRTGIVHEITQELRRAGINVEKFDTECVNAPMSGGRLFQVRAELHLPPNLTLSALRERLERIAHDLMVDISLHRAGGNGASS